MKQQFETIEATSNVTGNTREVQPSTQGSETNLDAVAEQQVLADPHAEIKQAIKIRG